MEEEAEGRLRLSRAHAAVAERELNSGSTSLTALWAIAGWGYLEAHFDEIMLVWLANGPKALDAAAESDIRIPLATYLHANDEERLHILYQELERKQGGALQLGAGRFESMLKPFGLGGPVDPEMGKTMFEFNQVRNCLVHRRGLADRRLIEACPWLGLTVGEKVVVTRHRLEEYFAAGVWYFLSISKRMRALLPESEQGDNAAPAAAPQ